MSLIQRFAWAYAAVLFVVTLLGYIPGLSDAEGFTFGIFKLDIVDDALHLGSALWAAGAAWHSTRAAAFYFKAFGAIYFFDGVLGFFLGQGYLDGGIFTQGVTPIDWGTKFAANLPHLLLGGAAMYIGFVLSRKFTDHA
ncbi:MAG: hypothetical protein H0T73_13315 [Ardenticatenales bacterium]|nr:hypothetical protein [Ardenticatenales bacterium]